MSAGVCPLSQCKACPPWYVVPHYNSVLTRTAVPAPAVIWFPSNGSATTLANAFAARMREGTAAMSSQRRHGGRRSSGSKVFVVPLESNSSVSASEDSSPSTSYSQTSQSSYTLEDTRTLVETAMLAAVSGLAYLLSTILKLENSLGYFLPLPVVLAALRSGGVAGWRTMMATCFLLIVLLGPLRAMSYFFLHGLLAATLGSLWSARAGFWAGVIAGALVRMCGQLSYLVLSSLTMNENMFALLLSNVYNMLDQASAALGLTGAPSPLAVNCTISSLLLINGLTYCFLVHVVYRVVLGAMGYRLGPLPGIVSNYINAGAVQQ